MANKQTNEVQKSQTNQIEELKKHPLWNDFREAYKESTGINPEESSLLMLVTNHWKLFISGAEAGVSKYKKSIDPPREWKEK